MIFKKYAQKCASYFLTPFLNFDEQSKSECPISGQSCKGHNGPFSKFHTMINKNYTKMISSSIPT